MLWDAWFGIFRIQKQGLSILEAEKVDDEDVWRRLLLYRRLEEEGFGEVWWKFEKESLSEEEEKEEKEETDKPLFHRSCIASWDCASAAWENQAAAVSCWEESLYIYIMYTLYGIIRILSYMYINISISNIIKLYIIYIHIYIYMCSL